MEIRERPGGIDVVDGARRGSYGFTSPAQAREAARREEQKAVRLNDRRAAERALYYRRIADAWEAQGYESPEDRQARVRRETGAKAAATRKARLERYGGSYAPYGSKGGRR